MGSANVSCHAAYFVTSLLQYNIIIISFADIDALAILANDYYHIC